MSSIGIAIGIGVMLVMYGLMILWLSHRAGKAVKDSAQEFYVGGRGIGPIALTGTVLMSLMSVLVILGYTAGMYRNGIGYFSGIVGVFMAAGLYLPVNYRLWLLSGVYHYKTPTDFFYHRFKSKPYALFLTSVYVVCIIPYIAVQVKGVANYIATSTNSAIPYLVVSLLFLVYAAYHVLRGGNKAVANTDAFAGFAGVFVLVVVTLAFIFKYVGGTPMTEVVSTIQASAKADVLKIGAAYKNPIGVFGLGLAVGGAIMAWPHFMQRAFMARDEKTMSVSAIGMALGYVFIMGICIYLWGVFIGPYVFPNLTGSETENILSLLAVNAAPFLVIIIALGVFAFGLSTADSFIVTAVSLIQNNLVKTPEEKQVKQAKWWIIGLTVLVAIVDRYQPAFIVTYAYQFSTPGFAQLVPSLLFGLLWKKATKEGAFAGLAVGFAMVVYTTFVKNPWPTMHVLLWGLIPNIIVLIVVSLLTQPDENSVNDIVLPLKRFFVTRQTNGWKGTLALGTFILILANFILPFISDNIYIGWIPLYTLLQLAVGLLWALFAYFWYKTRMSEPDGSKKTFTSVFTEEHLKEIQSR